MDERIQDKNGKPIGMSDEDFERYKRICQRPTEPGAPYESKCAALNQPGPIHIVMNYKDENTNGK